LIRNEKWSDDSIGRAYPTTDPNENRETYGEHFSNEPEPPIRNPIINAICNRRSIRLFKSDPVPDEILWTILEAARWAPSGEDVQPWSIVVIKDPEKRRKIYELSVLSGRRSRIRARVPRELSLFRDRHLVSEKRMREFRAALRRPPKGRRGGRFDSRAWEAPVHLLFIGHLFNGTPRAANLATENAMIAAVTLGLGTVWLGAASGAPQRSKNDPIRMIYDLLKIPIDNYRIVSWLCLGYPNQHPNPRPRYFIQDKVFFDEWGNWKEMPHPNHPRQFMELPEYARH